jgi:HAD superfamily hydrolase (TIGR01484 family)
MNALVCLDQAKKPQKEPSAHPRWIRGKISLSNRMRRYAAANRPSRSSAKTLIIFDLDGTLTESKSSLDMEMAALLSRLLEVSKVAIISGGAWPQYEKQLLCFLPKDARLHNLSLLPTCGTKFYRHNGTWQKLYSDDFTRDEKEKISMALSKAFELSGFRSKKRWGDVIEDRGSQITVSALGQEAPLEEKKQWDPDFEKRKRIKAIVEPLIPEFTIRLGGATSIDVTRLGIDKAYGVKKLQETLGVSIANMLFVGDALFPGGNDYPVKQAGVTSIAVQNPHETKRVIETIIACLTGDALDLQPSIPIAASALTV